MSLLRYQIFLSYAIGFLSLWYIALQREDLYELPRAAVLLIVWAPIWVVILVGLYLLLVLITGVISFKDCPEAAVELEREVEMAKADLKKRGII